jgi:Homeodomain-like domain
MANNTKRIHRTPPQPTKKPVAPKIPAIQQAKILQMAAAGKSLREIAREQGRDRRTVTKIVNQPEMRNILERVKSRLIQLADNAAASVEFAVDNEIDGKVALRILEGFGVLPSGRNVVVVEEAKPEDNKTPEEKHDALVEDYLRRALKLAWERNKVFGTPLPEVDE